MLLTFVFHLLQRLSIFLYLYSISNHIAHLLFQFCLVYVSLASEDKALDVSKLASRLIIDWDSALVALSARLLVDALESS